MAWDIIGNGRAVHALKAALDSGVASHAYLFAGPERVGRAAAARRFAQSLNCAADAPPCGECEQCRRIEGGLHADVHTVTVEPTSEGSARKAISIDQMRSVERTVALTPYEGRTRVVIIDPADEMSNGAQSAFLKTLEEPPEHVVFVLIAANPDRLLETIRSRCARIDFHLTPAGEIEDALRAAGVEAGQAHLLARLSAGRPGWALEAARSPKVLERRAEGIALARSLPEMTLADRTDLAERLSEAFKREREPVLAQLEDWQAWWRDVMLTAAGAGEGVAGQDMLPELAEDAGKYTRAEIARFLQALADTRAYLAENVQSRIALDALMLQAPRAAARR